MTIIDGAIQGVAGFTSGTGPSLKSTISSDEYETAGCFVTVTFPAGTYVQADDAQFDAPTAIQNSKRDGKTVTLLGATFVSSGDENGAVIGAGPCTVASSQIKCALLQEDLSTERAAGAMSATWNKPLTFFVSYRAKVNGE